LIFLLLDPVRKYAPFELRELLRRINSSRRFIPTCECRQSPREQYFEAELKALFRRYNIEMNENRIEQLCKGLMQQEDPNTFYC
jgi:hypothetical protein